MELDGCCRLEERALGTMSSDERHFGSPFSIGFPFQL